MTKTWLYADSHLGESRFELMGRPFETQIEMCDVLLSNYNKLVGVDDLVLWVGDAIYQKTPEFLPYVEQFNGNKVLFRGNHDAVFTDEQLEPYFKEIVPEGEGRQYKFCDINCWVTHYPTRGVQNLFNLVGHIHKAWRYQLNMFNVGVDVNNFRPVDSDSIGFHYKAITDFYDDDVWIAYNNANSSYVGIRGKKGSYFKEFKE